MTRLSGWAEIPKNIQHLQNTLKEERELLRNLDQAIESQHQAPEVCVRNSGHGDPTANLAIKMIARREKIAERIRMWELDIKEKECEIRRIESAAAQISQRDAEMLRRFYRDQERWETIADSMHLSRSRFYEILERARSRVEWLLME